jgi:hypothetical protein
MFLNQKPVISLFFATLFFATLLLAAPLLVSAEQLVSADQYAASTTAMASDRHDALLNRYHQISTALQQNQYGAPIYIQSTFGDEYSQGDVYALVKHNFATVSQRLNSPDQWCDVVLLHINVKGCNVKSGRQQISSKNVTIYVGRNYFQTPDEAHEMRYTFVPKVIRDNYVQVDLTSKDGPLGTSDYELIFEAIPFDDQTSFIHFKYGYRYGFMARLALDGYLATLGRHKVGFSVKGFDDDNEPLYVKGLQGIVERNSMRYFISIQSYLDTAALNSRQWDQRIDHWYGLAKRFERQLVEVRDDKYLKTKTQEYTRRDDINNKNKATVDTGHVDNLDADGQG